MTWALQRCEMMAKWSPGEMPVAGQILRPTLLETNMETQKGPHKDRFPLKGGSMGFHVSLGECKC